MAKQNQLPKPIFDKFDPLFMTHYSQMVDTVNSLAGYSGPIELNNHIQLNGNRIMGVGEPKAPNDAITSVIAQSRYSAAVLAPQLEATGSTPLKSVRRVNDPNQREQVSSFVNDLPSLVPNANSIIPILTNVGGGVQVTIPATLFMFADGSTVMLISRTDVLSYPASYAITSISSVGNLVTVVLSTPPALVAGNAATIDGVTPSSFNGTYTLTSVVGSTVTYQLSLGTVSGTGGTLDKNGVWYYSVKKRSNGVLLLGPFSSDSAANRLQVNMDGFQILAVVVVTASGGQVLQSGGGGSAIVGSPTAGSFF